MASDAPTIIDEKYEVVREIGHGGMGRIYECVEIDSARQLAVKVLHRKEVEGRGELVERFWREARSASSIDTIHIVKVMDTGRDAASGRPYLAMELMHGQDASEHLRVLGPMPVQLALRIVQQACVGLAEAHEAGVLHRDVKPANLFLDELEDGRILVKLLDFGVAKI
ncbi:MAG: serine/threonine-protein kinase, partial [Myxococcota bacterium]